MKKHLLVLAALLLSSATAAFSQVSLEKTDINLVVKPGEKVTGTILIKSDSDEDILLKSYFEDLIYPPPFEGLREARPLGTSAFSFGGWGRVIPSEFILPAWGKFTVTYNFDVPADAKGGYYGALLFERGSNASPQASLGIDVKIRTGVRFFLETDNSTRDGRIEDAVLSKAGMESAIINTGDVLLFCKASWHIMDKKGRVIKRDEFERSLPPKERSSFTVGLPEPLGPGEYTLFINCNIGAKKVFIKEVDFTRSDNGEVKIGSQRD